MVRIHSPPKLVTSMPQKGSIFLQDAFYLLTEKLFLKTRPQSSISITTRSLGLYSPAQSLALPDSNIRTPASPGWASCRRTGNHGSENEAVGTPTGGCKCWPQPLLPSHIIRVAATQGFRSPERSGTGTLGDKLTTSPRSICRFTLPPRMAPLSLKLSSSAFLFPGKFQPSEPPVERKS